MKIGILDSALHHPAVRQYVSGYLINGQVSIDAGCVGLYGTSEKPGCYGPHGVADRRVATLTQQEGGK